MKMKFSISAYLLISFLVVTSISVARQETDMQQDPEMGINREIKLKPSGSGNPDYIFYRGNALYEEGRYDEAVEEYGRLLEQGYESANLYYNLGNSYFKKGELGRAILNYERAKKLMPRDSDLASNYEYARSLIEGNITNISGQWFKRIFDKFDIFTINGLTIFLSALFASAVFFIITGLFTQAARRRCRIALPILIIVFTLSAFLLYNRISVSGKEAVIISENAAVRFEPLDNATTYFRLHEGMKVFILESKKGWRKVERFDGKAGWIREKEVEKVLL
ncbi:MAG TPA: tetratricopeptide repeat protein [Nitrospirae bacterium]|nr:tetratricopeptide repeat protein [bacterium BMS3Abin06]HDH12177.1 tetratricopeptide repeat protein [Nitrospirota bacterium]HDZ03117.1 tetratricopeptide repeat protein [Nitrospirota bacterium]